MPTLATLAQFEIMTIFSNVCIKMMTITQLLIHLKAVPTSQLAWLKIKANKGIQSSSIPTHQSPSPFIKTHGGQKRKISAAVAASR
jgi:hypothetical protein